MKAVMGRIGAAARAAGYFAGGRQSVLAQSYRRLMAQAG